jgi:hypothetical protein
MRVGREGILLEAVHFILDISCRSSAFAAVPRAREQLYLSIDRTLGLQVLVVGLLVKDADKEKYHKRRQASHA